MTQQNTKPLYKVLNEERTKRIWVVSDSSTGVAIQDKDMNETWQIAKFIEGTTLGNKKVDCPRSHKTAVANAQYTALCVNNFHLIAEALQELYNRAKIYGAFADQDDVNGKALAAAKEALSRIS